ncbi:MAG: Trk system potassium transporter TrkA [Lachnospiraceae bacterium]|nr:Trk system potassium transporter TrkA [Lachnospiraceae bacterium]
MNIIIVGCGKVGATLAQRLSGEKHNISIIDENSVKISEVTDLYDVKGIVGNGVSFKTLQEAGISGADLLIAVTGSDEQNLLCCCIAKKAGSCKTIARVRNPLYNEDIAFLREELGISLIINPELTCANEIARIFQFPSAVRIESFSKGLIEIMHFRVTKECLLSDYPLMNLRSKLGLDVIVCTVRRGEELIIPKGDFVFHEGDVVGFLARPQTATEFFKKVGIGTGKTRTAMLVGGGKISYYLAQRLLLVGISTKIIETDNARCQALSELLPKATIICGDGTDERLLMQEGLPNVDGFAALTGLDEENILVSLLARKLSKAKTVTKINRINFNSVLEDMQVDTTVFPRLLTADTIVRYARSMNESLGSNVENLYRIEDGKAEALEFYIKEPSAVTGTPIAQLNLRKDLTICSINRRGRIILPGGSDELKVGDHVVVVVKDDTLTEIDHILQR